jgi:hypothetical protein
MGSMNMAWINLLQMKTARNKTEVIWADNGNGRWKIKKSSSGSKNKLEKARRKMLRIVGEKWVKLQNICRKAGMSGRSHAVIPRWSGSVKASKAEKNVICYNILVAYMLIHEMFPVLRFHSCFRQIKFVPA